jgi:actin-related protein 6
MPRAAKAGSAPPALPRQTFVVDNGGFSLKAGFAPQGDESDETPLPKCHIVPNTLVRTRDRKTYVGAQAETDVSQWSEAIFRRPVEHGQIVSWEAQKEIWDQSMFDGKTAQKDLLVKSPADTTLILGENPNTLPALQKNADEIIMEEWGFGGYLRKNGEPLEE